MPMTVCSLLRETLKIHLLSLKQESLQSVSGAVEKKCVHVTSCAIFTPFLRAVLRALAGLCHLFILSGALGSY